MPNQHKPTIDRFGAAAGIASVLLLVGIIAFSSALPPPNRSLDEITRSARVDADAILRGSYLGALFTGTLMLFGAAVAARLHRADISSSGWWIIALAGIAGTSVGLVLDLVVNMFVRAVAHGAGGVGLWIGYPSGPDGVLIAVPLAVFLVGAGLGARESRALPRWLAWLALGLAAAFTVGAGGVAGDEVDGGVLGGFLLLGYAGLIVWILGCSAALARGAPNYVGRSAAAASRRRGAARRPPALGSSK